ncbi:MAG TPA: hypothetical protein VGQ79_02355 [Nitrospiraceae bacterium]|jgi:hypothetical protein|nr:hypothetical protein [Nitrospiraceae bacterium]
MTFQEDQAAHAKVLSESYEVHLEKITKLLTEGGVYVYPQVGGILTRGCLPVGSIQLEPFLNKLGRWILCSLPRRSNYLRREGFRSMRWRPWFFTGHCLWN